MTGDVERFTQLHNKLGAEQRKNPEVVFLESRFLMSRGQVEDARSLLEEYFEAGGDEPRFKLMLASMLLVSEDEADLRRGQEVIAELMVSGGEVSRVALGFLGNVPVQKIHPDLFPEDLDEWLQGLAEVRPREDLIVAKLKLARAGVDSAEKDEIFAGVVESHAEENPLRLAGASGAQRSHFGNCRRRERPELADALRSSIACFDRCRGTGGG